jgi:hypothetical protein
MFLHCVRQLYHHSYPPISFLYFAIIMVHRFAFTTQQATSQVLNIHMNSARGRAVTEHFNGPSAYGGVRGDTAAAIEAKRQQRTQAASVRQAGASLANTDQIAVEDALSSSSVVISRTTEQAHDAVAQLAATNRLGMAIDIERTTSPLYPVAAKKAKDRVLT